MDWSAIRVAIKAAVVSATGLLPQYVFFDGAPEATGWKGPSSTGWGSAPAFEPQLPPCTIELKIRRVESPGTDEARADYTATPTPGRTINRCGPRRIIVQFKIESQAGTDSLNCFAVESRLRTRLARKSIGDALQAAGMGMGDMTPAIAADYVKFDRQMSVCICEMPFHAAENDMDDTTGTNDWIESTRAIGTMADPSATVDTGQVPPP